MSVRALAPGQYLEPGGGLCATSLSIFKEGSNSGGHLKFSRPNPQITPKKHEREREDLDQLSEVIPEEAKPTVGIACAFGPQATQLHRE